MLLFAHCGTRLAADFVGYKSDDDGRMNYRDYIELISIHIWMHECLSRSDCFFGGKKMNERLHNQSVLITC